MMLWLTKQTGYLFENTVYPLCSVTGYVEMLQRIQIWLRWKYSYNTLELGRDTICLLRQIKVRITLEMSEVNAYVP
jgi:hypothetical protein